MERSVKNLFQLISFHLNAFSRFFKLCQIVMSIFTKFLLALPIIEAGVHDSLIVQFNLLHNKALLFDCTEIAQTS